MGTFIPILLRSLAGANAAENAKPRSQASAMPGRGVAQDHLGLQDVWDGLAAPGFVRSAFAGLQGHGVQMPSTGVSKAVGSRPMYTSSSIPRPVAGSLGGGDAGSDDDPDQPNVVSKTMGDWAHFLDSRIPALDDIAADSQTSNALRGTIAFGMPIARVGVSAASGLLGLGQLATSRAVRHQASENLSGFLMNHPVETTQKALKDWRAKPWNEQVSDLLVAGGSSLVGGGVAGKLKVLDYSPHITMGAVRNVRGQTGALNIHLKRNPKLDSAVEKPVSEDVGGAAQSSGRELRQGERSPHASIATAAQDLPQYLSPAEFAALPRAGSINAGGVRFSHNNISEKFRPPYGSMDNFIDDLKSGKVHPSEVKPIRIVVYNDGVYTLDNRRLHSFKEAGIDVPYQKLDAVPVDERKKFSTKNGGTSITIRKGKTE